MTLCATYLDVYVVERGITRFLLPKKCTFVCVISSQLHLVDSNIVFQSDHKDGTFIYCTKHQDFFDVSEKPMVERL